jgi:hypothetical protein
MIRIFFQNKKIKKNLFSQKTYLMSNGIKCTTIIWILIMITKLMLIKKLLLTLKNCTKLFASDFLKKIQEISNCILICWETLITKFKVNC